MELEHWRDDPGHQAIPLDVDFGGKGGLQAYRQHQPGQQNAIAGFQHGCQGPGAVGTSCTVKSADGTSAVYCYCYACINS
jgi:hypothetical protein